MLLQPGLGVVHHVLGDLPEGDGQRHQHEDAADEDALVALLEAVLDGLRHQDGQQEDDDDGVHRHHGGPNPVPPFSEEAEQGVDHVGGWDAVAAASPLDASGASTIARLYHEG